LIAHISNFPRKTPPKTQGGVISLVYILSFCDFFSRGGSKQPSPDSLKILTLSQRERVFEYQKIHYYPLSLWERGCATLLDGGEGCVNLKQRLRN
jgi:hypothetical protein